MAKKREEPKSWWGKAWHFIWHDDSLASWLVNIVLAFILIKFVLYPLLSLVLGTSLPLVAVVSQSMDHGYVRDCSGYYDLCGRTIDRDAHTDFSSYWGVCGDWYAQRNISRDEFSSFPLKRGFSKGDIILLHGKDPSRIEVGDVIVFSSRAQLPRKPYPIIHRVVAVHETDRGIVFETKGDHNSEQITPRIDPLLDETSVGEDQVIGVAAARVPLLGWVKVGLMELLQGGSC